MGHLYLSLLAFSFAPWVEQADGLDEEIRKRVPLVQRWAADPVVIRAVRRANTENPSMQEVESRDRRWQATSGTDEFMRAMLENSCSDRLRALGARTPELGEAFVTDQLGANVAMTQKTSDYWQGDEEKFTAAFTNRASAFHIDPVSFDDSIQAYAVQISVPVLDGGRAIGVLVVTLNLERMQ